MSHVQEAGPSHEAGPSRERAKVPTKPAEAPGRKRAYLLGAASGLAVALFAPLLRPAARSAVRGGIRVGRYAKKVASNVKEEFEDIVVEAQADLDREENTENGNRKA